MPRSSTFDTQRRVRREELLNLLLLQVPLKQCAARLGVNLRTLERDVNDPEFATEFNALSARIHSRVVQKLADQNKSLAERINVASEEAIEKLRLLIDSEHQGLALKACDSVLDRNVETARCQHVESDVRGRFSIDPATLMHIAMTAKEIEEPEQKFIEGDISEEESYERTGEGNQGDREESRPDS